VARAVIAAARSYGDDPVRAMTTSRGVTRRSLTAAAAGISEAAGVSFTRAAQVVGIREQNLSRSRSTGGDVFEAARRAAFAAVAAVSPAVVTSKASGAPDVKAAQKPAIAALPAEKAAARPLLRPRIITALAARREVLRVLAIEPCTGPDLMEILNLAEGQVRQALRDLSEEREVRHTALTAEGWTAQTWRIPEGAPA
jgi:hypothetical protein